MYYMLFPVVRVKSYTLHVDRSANPVVLEIWAENLCERKSLQNMRSAQVWDDPD